MEKIKVYLYYLKSDKTLYAFTMDKAIKNEFELERCMSLYKKKIVNMDELEFKSFSYLHNDQMLFCNTLSDGESDLSFATTYVENCILETRCVKLEDHINDICRKISQFPIQKKIKKSLNKVLHYYGDGIKESIYHFDTFKIFLDEFRDTIFMR